MTADIDRGQKKNKEGVTDSGPSAEQQSVQKRQKKSAGSRVSLGVTCTVVAV
jgi:hypothetical protein